MRDSASRTCRDFRWRSASVATSCGPKASAGRISRSGCPSRQGLRFRIGHASKALTSAAVGLLLEKGRLHLDDEIQTYVPAFPRKQWPVTLRQLMGHVAGVRHYPGEEADMPSGALRAGVRRVAEFRGRSAAVRAGDPVRYSTYGWVLVSAAVEAAADEPFFTFMRTQIFTPLGMPIRRPTP